MGVSKLHAWERIKCNGGLNYVCFFCQVTQRFFETVSAQLERWYERKVVEVEQQAELRVQQDRTELLERISMLEEELQKLLTNEKAES